MPTPTSGNIIKDEDIFDYFKTAIKDVANGSIVYGTDNKHFSDLPTDLSNEYGGTIAGLSQTSWSHEGDDVDASQIVDYVVTEATKYSRMRKASVKKTVTASGVHPITGPMQPIITTVTGKTHLKSTYGDGFSAPSSTDIATNKTIDAAKLVSFFDNCKTEYLRLRDDTVSGEYSVCHNSCHINCHSSRGRR